MSTFAWIRILKVTLTSTAENGGKVKQLVFGDNEQNSGMPDLSISVEGNKYMSTLKDYCTVKIANLTYAEIVRIIMGKFYGVKIECGYRSANTFTIFDGGVMYISNLRESVETNTVTILCASHIVARYGQTRLNLSFNSGINLYAAINFICKVGGVNNPNLSTQFKKQFHEGILNCKDQSAAEVIAGMTDKNGSYITSSDCIGNSFMTMFDASKSNARVITLNEDNIMLTNGFPRMTTEGLTFSTMPTFQYQCGDVVVINNELIQIDVQSQTDASKNLGGLLDKYGAYMIFEMHYSLQNRGNNFFVQISAKTRSKISSLLS